jgi:5-methylthioadenosine/S-adenosylhomocysteine deaminase
MVDRIISATWIAPVRPENKVLADHAIAIKQGEIVGLLPLSEALKLWPDAPHEHLDDHLLTPGFINTHTHAAMNLFRGMADDKPLMDWLSNHIWPAEGQWMSPEFVRDGTELAIAEMQAAGITCFNDMYFFPNVAAEAAQKAQMRAVVGLIVLDFPSVWANSSDEYFDKGLQTHDQVNSYSLVSTAFAPHAPYTVSDKPLIRALTLADELDIPLHIHLHETAGEIEESNARYGMRPLERLSQLGLLNPRLLAVHMTQLLDAEIETLAKQGVNISHCIKSNLKLASGFAPITKLLNAGANIALGTDSAASNNELDLLSEARLAALVAKGLSNDAKVIPSTQALEMLTINGAKALNLDATIGSLEIGKSADIVAIDLGCVATQPVYDPIVQLIYSCSREQVRQVWIAGKQVLKDGLHTRIDTPRALALAKEWAAKINVPNIGNE